MITSLNIQLLCHATEDEKRIKTAVESLFGISFNSETLMGHFENPINFLKVELKKSEALRVLNLIKSELEILDFEKKSEKSEFFFRLSKDALLRNEIKEGKEVRFRVGIQIFPSNAKKVEEFMQEFWNA